METRGGQLGRGLVRGSAARSNPLRDGNQFVTRRPNDDAKVSCEVEPFEGWKPEFRIVVDAETIRQLRGRTL